MDGAACAPCRGDPQAGGNPAARVYESIGPDFFLAVAPGWLNLGLWEVPGSEDEVTMLFSDIEGSAALLLTINGPVAQGR